MPQIEWLLSLHALISGTGFSKLPGETHPLWTLQRPVQQKTPRVGSGFGLRVACGYLVVYAQWDTENDEWPDRNYTCIGNNCLSSIMPFDAELRYLDRICWTVLIASVEISGDILPVSHLILGVRKLFSGSMMSNKQGSLSSIQSLYWSR